MTLQDLLHEAKTLSIEDRRELIKLLEDTISDEALDNTPQSRDLMELAGLGAEIWQGIDAQDYVNQLRNEWDDRP